MKVLVCGGRSYDNKKYLDEVLDMIHVEDPITCLVHGDASGADTLGDLWAMTRKVDRARYPAEWDKYKHAAGPIRNALMLKENPDIELVVVFPGNAGTRNMRAKAEKAKIDVLVA